MTLRRKLSIAAVMLLIICAVCWFASEKVHSTVYVAWREAYFAVRPVPRHCKERAAKFGANVDRIKHAAKNSLKPGVKKDDVARFFASENIPVTFDQIGQEYEATGAIFFEGLAECEDIACGDDSALIGVRVRGDVNGTVVSDPEVIGTYTDCM